MGDSSPDSWKTLFFGAAAVLIALQAWRGWQMGVVRQVVKLLALAGSYVCAWIGGPQLAPHLEPLGFPHPVLIGIAGTLLGTLVFVSISVVSSVLFKKTSDQTVGVVRFGYGLAGAAVGMIFGFVLVWAGALAVRVLGTLAETEVRATAQRSASQPVSAGPRPPEVSGWIRGIAEMKHSLDQGTSGSLVQQIDPIPGAVYSTLQKVGLLAGSEQGLVRFLSHPDVKRLAEHPKIKALQADPQIAKDVVAQNFLDLLRNPKLVAAANDSEIIALVRKLDLEKALDYGLGTPERSRADGHKPKADPNDTAR